MKITPNNLVKTGGNVLAYQLKLEMFKNADEKEAFGENYKLFLESYDDLNKIYYNAWKLSGEAKKTIDEYEKFIPLLDNCRDFLQTLMQNDILESISGFFRTWQKPDAKLEFTKDEYLSDVIPSFKFFALFNDILPIKNRNDFKSSIDSAIYLKKSLDDAWNTSTPDISFTSIIAGLKADEEVKNFSIYKFNCCY